MQQQSRLSMGDAGSAQPDATAMNQRRRRLAAVRVGGLTLVAIIVALIVVALPDVYAATLTPDVLRDLRHLGFSPALYASILLAESIVSSLVYLALGLVLLWRRPDDRVALFCALMLVTFGGGVTGFLFDPTIGSPVGALARNVVLRFAATLVFVTGEVSLITFFYIAPSGRFVPRWTRWCAVLALIYWGAVVFYPPLFNGLAGSTVLILFATALAAQVYRYWRVSTPVEREQTKWIVVGIVAAVAIIAVPQLIASLFFPGIEKSAHDSPVLGTLVFGSRWIVALLLIPISIAIAVLRARLWDIDIIINRALVYTVLTALLAAVYAGLTIGAESLAEAITQRSSQQPLATVAATLAIAALFHPLRRRVQNVIDRRFYRRKYDVARTVADFAATLRTETDLTQLSDQLLAVVQETMQPTHVSLWLRPQQRRYLTRKH
ncbi:MAG: hypothetical protein PVSMB4_13120 [Ktedonobacterales bacterium]